MVDLSDAPAALGAGRPCAGAGGEGSPHPNRASSLRKRNKGLIPGTPFLRGGTRPARLRTCPPFSTPRLARHFQVDERPELCQPRLDPFQ